MELIERHDLRKIHYLYSLSFIEFKALCSKSCKNEEERKVKFKIMQEFCKTNIKTRGETKRIYSYSQLTIQELGGRLYCGNSIQGLQSHFRGFLMSHTTDIDMKNAHPVILRYVCKKYNIPCPNLEYYINNRDSILEGFPDKAEGKTAFLKSVNDNKHNFKIKDKFFKKFDIEMKVIQGLLTSMDCYKDIKSSVPESSRYNWNGSTINRILCMFENQILQIVIDSLNHRGIEISALMFDGVMPYGDFYEDEELLEYITNEVEKQCEGLNMQFAYKPHSNQIQIPEDFVIPTEKDKDEKRLVANNDVEARDIIYEMVKNDLKCINKRLFYKTNHIWKDDGDIIDKIILDIILKAEIYKITEKDKYISYSQNISQAKNILEALYVKVKTQDGDDNIYEKFHITTKNRICFKDGVLDFKAKKFFLWNEIDFEYYSCVCINREFNEYFKNPERIVINELKNELYRNFYGDKIDIALQFTSRAITGNYEDKNFATYLGNRDCGKGAIYDNLVNGFEGVYIKTFELGNILYNRLTSGAENVDCSKKLYWLMDLEFTRLAISQEIPDPNAGLKASGKMLKKIAGGGDTIVARRNYDRFDTHFKIDTTFMIMGNNSLQVDTPDCMEHCLEFESVIQYKTQAEISILALNKTEIEMTRYKVRNASIKDKCKTLDWGNAIVYLLFENWTDETLSIIPENTCEDSISIIGIVEKHFTITNDKKDIILCSYLYDTLNTTDKKKVDLELKSINIMKKKCNSGEIRNKWCFYGLKEIVNTENSE